MTNLVLNEGEQAFVHGAMPFNSQAWFITTLIPFYIAFPYILQHLLQLSSKRLSSLLSVLFYIQALPLFLQMASWSFPHAGHVYYWVIGEK